MKKAFLMFTEFSKENTSEIIYSSNQAEEIDLNVVNMLNSFLFYDFENQNHKNSLFLSELSIFTSSLGFIKDGRRLSCIFIVNTEEKLDSYISHILEEALEETFAVLDSKWNPTALHTTSARKSFIGTFESKIKKTCSNVNDLFSLEQDKSKIFVPNLKENQIEYYSKLLTFHLTHSMHTSVTKFSDFVFLNNFTLPFQRLYSNKNTGWYNKYFFLQVVKQNDKNKTEFENVVPAPWCTDLVTKIISFNSSDECKVFCQKKFDECIKTSAGLVAVMGEKFRTTGGETLDEEQIKDICNAMKIEDVNDIKMFLSVAQIYKDSLYGQFFSKYENHIKQFIN